MHIASLANRRLTEMAQEDSTIEIREEQVAPVIATNDQVLGQSRNVNASGPRHSSSTDIGASGIRRKVT
jgi:hypothetical protein